MPSRLGSPGRFLALIFLSPIFLSPAFRISSIRIAPTGNGPATPIASPLSVPHLSGQAQSRNCQTSWERGWSRKTFGRGVVRGRETCAQLRRVAMLWCGTLSQPEPAMPLARARGAAGLGWEACPRPSLPTRGRRERRPRAVRSERATLFAGRGTRMANHGEAAIRRPDGRRDGTRSLPATIFRSVLGTLGGSSYQTAWFELRR